MTDKANWNVLALDLATKTGWAYGKANAAKPKSGSIKFGEDGWSRPHRYREFRGWVAGFCNLVKPDLIVFERAFVGKNVQVARFLYGLSEHLEELLYDCGIPVHEASVSEIRHHFCGRSPRGDEGKELVKQTCRTLGWTFDDDNAADACALWDYQRSIIAPKFSARSTPLFRSVK